jgi:hypothetical protein
MADRMKQLFSRLNPQQNQPPVPLMSNLMMDNLPQQPSQAADPHHLKDTFAQTKHLEKEQSTLLRLQYDYEFVQHLVSPDYVKYLL